MPTSASSLLSGSSWAVPLWTRKFTFLLALISALPSNSLYSPLTALLSIFSPDLIGELWRVQEMQTLAQVKARNSNSSHHCHHLPQKSASDFTVNNKSKYYRNGTAISSTGPEHCLYISSWAPKNRASLRKSVLVTVSLAVAFAILDQEMVWHETKQNLQDWPVHLCGIAVLLASLS